MGLIYNIGIYIYKLGIFIASFFNDKAKKLRNGQAEAFKLLNEKVIPNANYIWFHAASLGEFEQGRPLIESLKQSQPETKILLTFFSPSGYEVRKNYNLADIIIYLPLDTPFAAKKFLRTVSVSKAIFIKYEFWPNYLKALKRAGIPTYSISAIFRPKQIFFKSYGMWYRCLLMGLNHIFVQDCVSMDLLKSVGVNNCSVAGDTRFDRVVEIANQAKQIPLVEAFIGDTKKVIVAGSSWPKDEEILLKYLKNNPDVKLILVPHEIHKAHITGICNMLDGGFVKFTEATSQNVLDKSCLIVDTIGMLSSIYQYAQIAYIGGGFGVGIHNTLEAAVWNVPVVFGTYYQKFREARELIEIGGAFSIDNYATLGTVFNQLFDNSNAGKIAGSYVSQNKGATKLILNKMIKN